MFKKAGDIVHCKNSIGINSNYLLYKEGSHTVRNKGDFEDPNLKLIPDGMGTFFIPLTISKSVYGV